jgi:hypothetical protein
MKTLQKTMGALLVLTLALALLAPAVAEAQPVKVVTNVIGPFTAYKGATDSTNSVDLFSIPYEGVTYPELQGQYPDSIKVRSFSDGDSTISMAIYFKGKHSRASLTQQTRTLVDSLVSATATAKAQVTLIAPSTWQAYDYYNIALVANTWVTAHNSANGPEVYVEIQRFFKKP